MYFLRIFLGLFVVSIIILQRKAFSQKHISVAAAMHEPFPFQCYPHLEISQIICNANQLTNQLTALYEGNLAMKKS